MENRSFTVTELSSHLPQISSSLLHKIVDEFLDEIITGDGTWVAHITPEIKQQSLHWHQ